MSIPIDCDYQGHGAARTSLNDLLDLGARLGANALHAFQLVSTLCPSMDAEMWVCGGIVAFVNRGCGVTP